MQSRADRALIESGVIALLSNFGRAPIDPASTTWLGHHADRSHVRRSHLWNVRHVADDWSDGALEVLAARVRGEAPHLTAQPPPQEALVVTTSSRRASHVSSGSHGAAFVPELWALLEEHLHAGMKVLTLAQQKPNTIVEIGPTGLVLQTERSISLGSAGETVPAWMFNTAWERLTSRGSISRDELLRELNVKRSSAVLAVLATLPVVAHGGRSMHLRLEH